jgi:hypothetical protein
VSIDQQTPVRKSHSPVPLQPPAVRGRLAVIGVALFLSALALTYFVLIGHDMDEKESGTRTGRL